MSAEESMARETDEEERLLRVYTHEASPTRG